MEDYKLLECPFCGSEGLMSHVKNRYNDAYVVTCSGEKDNSCCACALSGYLEEERDAADEWNKRA